MKAKSRYEIKDVIARGGMGVVYRAQDKVMNRLVALKTIHDLSDPRAIRMFQREWQDLASLIHPNIVEVFDVGEIEVEGETRPYLVMPLLPGCTLDELIKTASHRLTVERSVDIISQTCRGLQAAHDRGIVHRDLKPSNIFVMSDDAVKIIDFGVAGRLDKTKTLGRKGTLLYMSPEQLENKPISAVSDIFSLAVVCYETLSRRRPFERATEEDVVEAILRSTPPPVTEFNPAVSTLVSQVIHKAMAKQPWHRFASAREFAETLQKALRNDPIESLNPVKIRARIQRSKEAFERGDLGLSGEIIGELEAEGHLDPDISDLKKQVDRALMDREVGQLLESARVREEHQEYPLALQKVHEVLQLNPRHTEALALKSRIENRRTELDIEEWIRVTHQHLDNFAYSHAREALQRILQLRPREPRALQMLSEVDRREQSYVQLRQQKDELYRAAVDAERNGELSAALSKAERVLELDKQAPETQAPGRSAAYQNFYNKIRSTHESLKAAFEEARTHLVNRNHAAALAICDRQLKRFPNSALFQALRVDIEEQRRQALSSSIAETDRSVEAEPDLNRRVSILEEAQKEYPGEQHFESALQLARHKRGLVESIVAKARAHEERGQFGEAITQWETLQTIHNRYAGIALELERLRKRRVQQERADRRRRWVEQVEQKLERNEFAPARDVLKGALEDFPEDAELMELGKLAERGLERSEESKRVFEAGREAYQAQRFEEATKLLRQAIELDDRNPAIRSALLETLVRRAQDAHEREPVAAETLLREALDIEPNHALAKGLMSLIADQCRIDRVERCVSRARQLQNENDLRGALKEVDEGLRSYPDESRLTQLRGTLEKSFQEDRRHDLEEARRLERDAQTAQGAEASGQISRRLQTIVTRYEGDHEFQNLMAGARKRVETFSPPTRTLKPEGVWRKSRLPRLTSVSLRSPWLIGGIAALVVMGLAIPVWRMSRPHPKPAAPVVVQVAPEPAPVVAPPEMDSLTIIATGKVDIDGSPPQDLEEVFTRAFPIGGEHTVNIHSGSGGISFAFGSQPGQPASVKLNSSQDVLAFLVSAAGDKRTIYSNRSLDLKMDGLPIGKVSQAGLDLSAATPGIHKLEWAEGQGTKSREIQFETARALVVNLDSDPNTGSAVVKLNVPGSVDVSIRNQSGKEVQHVAGANGEWRPSPLRAGKYTVEATPAPSYQRSTAELVIRKGAEQIVALDFSRIPVAASIVVHALPRARIQVNGNPAVEVDNAGNYTFSNLTAGHYRFVAQLTGYRDAVIERDLSEGTNQPLQLAFVALMGTVTLEKSPVNSVVSWQRAGDSKWEPFEGTSKELPEGDYVFRGEAAGYASLTTPSVKVQAGRPTPVAVRLARGVTKGPAEVKPVISSWCAGWAGGQEEEKDCLLKTMGFQAYANPVDHGTVELLLWSQDDRLKWQVGYRDANNFWEFELNNKSLKCTAYIAKKKSEKCNEKINVDLGQWHRSLLTVTPGELRMQLYEVKGSADKMLFDKTFKDPQYDLKGQVRVEVRKPVSVELVVKP